MGHTTDDPRTITAAGFSRLLARLDPDVERAGHEYGRLRDTLVRFFEWRGAPAPEECADDALDRLARRLEETTVADVRGYLHGIARLVLLERRRRSVPDSLDDHPDLAIRPASDPSAHAIFRNCLECCLARLDAGGRRLALEYYEGQGLTKIDNRRRLAATLGISEVTLRGRVRRLRDRLERCVHACVSMNEGGRP